VTSGPGAHVNGPAVFWAVSALARFARSPRYAPRATGHPTEAQTPGTFVVDGANAYKRLWSLA
jgi:hypothetical protein